MKGRGKQLAAKSDAAWEEVVDFLLTQPSPKQIADFEGSEDFRAYVRDLRDKNRNGQLTDEDRREMEEIGRIGQFMRLLKIRALERMERVEKTPQP